MNEEWYDEFAFNDPFRSWSVGEEEIWAEDEAAFPDVASIHQEAFQVLKDDIDFVKRNPRHITQVRFVVGTAGSGKSHLFSRLRRWLGGQAIFVFAANPPRCSEDILPWLLKKMIFGMRHPRLDGGLKPYSQLHAALYAALMLRFRFPGSMDEFHEAAQANRDDLFPRACDFFTQLLLPEDPDIARGLVYALHPQQGPIAFRWLSGSTNLFDEELKAIEQREPLSEEAALPLLALLGKANTLTRTPIVLVLDQLDLVTTKDLIDEFQRFLFGLIDASKNWYVIISLIQDVFDLWGPHLSQALRDRIMRNGQLPIVELREISDPLQKQELLTKRLTLPYLVRLREQYRLSNPLFPFAEADMHELISGEPICPRHLFVKASERYQERVTGRMPPKPLLDVEIETAFKNARAALNEQELLIDKRILADRLAELIEIVCVAGGRSFESSTGPLERTRNLKGTDTIFRIGGREIRLLGHHIHQRWEFPSFLKLAMTGAAAAIPTILVRDSAVPVRGQVSLQRLAEFKKDKTFIHLPRSAIADTYALGQVLAEMREGNFNDLPTDPPPTPENIKRCLGQIPCLAQNEIMRKVFELIDKAPPPPPPLSPAPPPPPMSLVEAVRKAMHSARWLVFERLHRQLKTSHLLEISEKDLRDAIATPPLRDELLCYPPDIHMPAGIHILIWSAE